MPSAFNSITDASDLALLPSGVATASVAISESGILVARPISPGVDPLEQGRLATDPELSAVVEVENLSAPSDDGVEGTDEQSEFACTVPGCSRVFPTFRGVRLHLRKAHFDEFNAERIAKVTALPLKRRVWTREEKLLVVDYLKRNGNLLTLPARELSRRLADSVLQPFARDWEAIRKLMVSRTFLDLLEQEGVTLRPPLRNTQSQSQVDYLTEGGVIPPESGLNESFVDVGIARVTRMRPCGTRKRLAPGSGAALVYHGRSQGQKRARRERVTFNSQPVLAIEPEETSVAEPRRRVVTTTLETSRDEGGFEASQGTTPSVPQTPPSLSPQLDAEEPMDAVEGGEPVNQQDLDWTSSFHTLLENVDWITSAELAACRPGGADSIGNQNLVDIWQARFDEKFPQKSKGKPVRRRTQEPSAVPRSNRSERRIIYRKVQRNWRKDRARCGSMILDGTWRNVNVESKVSSEAMDAFWKPIFEGAICSDERNPEPIRPIQWCLLQPIHISEVEECLKGVSGGKAAGPDGRDLKALKAIGPRQLTGLFNSYLYAGTLPNNLTGAFTTLIPKEVGTDDPAKHRPITVSSFLVRSFHKILARRLDRHCPVGTRQKGFRPGDGIAQNLSLLDTVLGEARKGREAHLAFLDIRKAFDSVHHESILKAAVRAGVPPPLVSYLSEVYKSATTRIKGRGGLLGELLRVTRGVRQGDPLSSVLFNFVMDWAMSFLSPAIGVELAGHVLTHLAFADDLVIFAGTRQGLNMQVNTLLEGLGLAGLEPNASKCATLSIKVVPGTRQWFVDTTSFLIVNGVSVTAMATDSDPYRYLGLYQACSAVRHAARTKIVKGLEQLDAAPLKPQQRVWMLTSKLLPSVLHELSCADAKLGYIRAIDTTVRKSVRKWLRLPKDTPVSAFHTAEKDGGLGIISLEYTVPALRLRRRSRLPAQLDEACQAMARTDRFKEQLDRCEQMGEKQLNGYPVRTREEQNYAWKQELYGSVDGSGLKPPERFKTDPRVLKWVTSGNLLMNGRRFCSAVGLRLGVLSTAARRARGRPQRSRTCRFCGPGQSETIGHVMQNCPAVHGLRVKRHDRVVKAVRSMLERKGYAVLEEPHIPIEPGDGPAYLKPDIVVHGKGIACVLDVCVCSDQSDVLEQAYHGKLDKYSRPEIRQFVSNVSGIDSAEVCVDAVAFNWRGVLAQRTTDVLRKLGLSRAALNFLAVVVVEGGCSLHVSHQTSTGVEWAFRGRRRARMEG